MKIINFIRNLFKERQVSGNDETLKGTGVLINGIKIGEIQSITQAFPLSIKDKIKLFFRRKTELSFHNDVAERLLKRS